MKIEVLYPEVGNLFGDLFNIKYLQKILPNATFYFTSLNETPKFVSEEIDLLYLGPMTEKAQEIAIERLKKYKDRIKECIDNNKYIIFTGNAGEILGEYILKDDGTKIKGLNIVNFYTKRDMLNRYGYPILGKYKNIDVVGFKSGFTYIYGDNSTNYFVKLEKGIGINKNSKLEGFKINNLIITSIIGPIFILNPLLLKELLKKIGFNKKIYLHKEMLIAYNKRLSEFKRIEF